MEENISAENIKIYLSWRDELLKTIGEKICKECTDPRKGNMKLNYENPLNCECKCERVENILTRASNIDADIKLLLNSIS